MNEQSSERSLATSLRTIVRRVLRTKIGRTHFELRILDEARRLLEKHCRDLSRDALTKLVVDSLLQSRRVTPVTRAAGLDWAGTQALVAGSTILA